MEVYLLAIAVHSTIYSRYYGQVDTAWRSSWRCSIVGSLAIISSEQFDSRSKTTNEIILLRRKAVLKIMLALPVTLKSMIVLGAGSDFF